MKTLLPELWKGMTLREGITDAVDILVVAYIIYRVLLLVKGTRAAQMLIGIALVGSGFFLAKLFELTTLTWLLDHLVNYSIIFFIVIFQYDIRRGLVRVGQNLFGRGRQYEETFVFEEVIKAAEQLARSRMGGLIVIEREADLDEFLGDLGVIVDSRVTKELLIALFLPEPDNTVHDGAVLIKNLRVFRAGCVLPLSANPKLDKALGTRHRAAIGITEETDAVVVVVSEERGTISLCFNGNIARDLDGATLRKALLGLFQKEKRAPRKKKGEASESAPASARSPSSEQTQRVLAGVVAEGVSARGTATQPMSVVPPAATATRATVPTMAAVMAAASGEPVPEPVDEAAVSHGAPASPRGSTGEVAIVSDKKTDPASSERP